MNDTTLVQRLIGALFIVVLTVILLWPPYEAISITGDRETVVYIKRHPLYDPPRGYHRSGVDFGNGFVMEPAGMRHELAWGQLALEVVVTLLLGATAYFWVPRLVTRPDAEPSV